MSTIKVDTYTNEETGFRRYEWMDKDQQLYEAVYEPEYSVIEYFRNGAGDWCDVQDITSSKMADHWVSRIVESGEFLAWNDES